MDRMQKIALLMAWYALPWGAAKGQSWEMFSRDKVSLTEEGVFTVISWIINGVDDKRVNWSVFEDFFNDTCQRLEEETTDAGMADRIDVV